MDSLQARLVGRSGEREARGELSVEGLCLVPISVRWAEAGRLCGDVGMSRSCVKPDGGIG